MSINIGINMNIELLKMKPDDLSVVNVARASFGNWKDVLDESDTGLIKYLAKHKHISPFFHQRFTFKTSTGNYGGSIDLPSVQEYSTLSMGLEVEITSDNAAIISHSFFGWVAMIKEGMLIEDFEDDVLYTLAQTMPISLAAYDLPTDVEWVGASEYIENPESYQHRNVSIRVVDALPVVRQLFTHRRFATNEISRRYVSTLPTIHIPDEFRARPEGSIKQGSTGLVEDQEGCLELYNKSIQLAIDTYSEMLGRGVAPEQARYVLPQAMETTVIFTGSIDAWLALITLRTSDSTQYETKLVAEAIHKAIALEE